MSWPAPTGRLRRWAAGITVVAACLLPLAGSGTASAVISGISPTATTIDAGATAKATVRIKTDTESCVQAGTDSPDITVSIEGAVCGGEREVKVVVRTTEATPGGTYAVVVSDESSSRTFSVTVRGDPPTTTTTTAPPATTTPPPPPATTTTAAGGGGTPATTTTTTGRGTTTTTTAGSGATTTRTLSSSGTTGSAGGTSSAATTDAGSGPGTTTAGERRGKARATEVLGGGSTAGAGDLGSPSPSRSPAFASIDTLVALGPPARGLFLPFVGNAYHGCQPRLEPCADRRLGLMLVAADAAGLAWTPVDEGAARPADVRVDGLAVSTVGAPPPAPETSSYLLTLLDLRPTAGRLRTVERTLDAEDLLTAPAEPGPLVRPTITDAALPVPPQPYGMPAPFEEPRAASADEFRERVPVYVVAPWAEKVEVVYGVLPAADWRRKGVVPLLGTGRLPYFARTAAGVTGLYVPGAVAGGRDTGGEPAQTTTRSPLIAIAVALLALITSLGVGAVLRRRAEE